MSARRPTLEEWFLAFQLRRMQRENAYATGSLTVEVTALVNDHAARGERPSFPCVLSRAAALAAVAVPRANRMYLSLLWGDRIVEPEGVHINMPIRHAGPHGPVLTVECFRDADQRSAHALRQELRAHVQAGLDGTTVTRLAATRPNRPWWRLALRLLWFGAWRLGGAARHGGCITVSCPASGRAPGVAAHFTGPTPGSILLALCAIREEGGRTWLDLGFTANHLVLDGADIRAYLEALTGILEGRSPDGVAALR